MNISLGAIISLCAVIVCFTSPCWAEENTGPALQQKMLENASKYSELIEANNGMPVPLLSNDELIILIKPMQERFKKAGKEYTDLEVANMLGALGLAEAMRRNMEKALSK